MCRCAVALALAVVAACGPNPAPECTADTADCNDDPDDGCETDLTSPDTCGDCDNSCQAPSGAVARCVESVCAFECEPGLVQCVNDCLGSCPFRFDTAGENPFDIPQGCFRVSVKAWGGGGGDGENNTNGAAGGFASAELDVTPGDPMVVAVGGAGGDGAGNTPGAGGMPGGGVGGNGSSQPGGGGGGLSGLFAGSVSVDGALVVAGGGAGSGGGGNAGQTLAGAGGGVDGEPGRDAAVAMGGGVDTGFGPLNGGPGGSRANGDGGGGGGAGWFGGFGGGGADSDASGGGGGSGFIAAAGESITLESGVGTTPGNASDPDRQNAGDPGEPGFVLVTCIPQ